MKKFVLLLSIFVVLSSFLVKAHAIEIDATSYMLFEAKTGFVLEEKNIDQRVYPASTTKIMTGILALESGDLERICTASTNAVYNIGAGGMHIAITPGEKIRMIDLIHGLLVQSANETANIIAEDIAGSQEEFVKMMNEKAIELGALNTTFKNPCGKDSDESDIGHNTTAKDLAIMSKYAMSMPEFREIVAKSYYKMPATNKRDGYTIYSTNRLMTRNEFKSGLYEKINGVKTGYTSKAGYTLVSSAYNEEGIELISVILGMKTGDPNRIRYASKKLLEHGFRNYSRYDLVKSDTRLEILEVENAEEETKMDLVTSEGLSFIKPLEDNQEWKISKIQKIYTPIKAPIKKGDIVGEVEYLVNGKYIGTVDIIGTKNVNAYVPPPPSGIIKLLKTVINVILVLGLMILVLRFIVRNISRRRMRYLMPKSRNRNYKWRSDNKSYYSKKSNFM